MTHHLETMAYARGVKPWHGLGTEVSNDMTPQEILTAAGLDWTVSKRPMYFPRLVDGGPVTMRVVPDEFALVRDSDDSVLDTIGSTFKPVQNHEVFDFFTRFVKAGDMKMETAGSLKGGRFIWALARITEGFKVGNKDEIRGYLLLSQPHQFGFSLTAALTPVCVVCWNTLNMALGSSLDGANGSNSARFRMPHTQVFNDEIKSMAENALGLASAGMKAFSHTAELLASKAATENDVVEFFLDVARIDQSNKDEEDLVEAQPQMTMQELIDDIKSRTVKRLHDAWQNAPGQELDCRRGTWWGAANAVTYYADHMMTSDGDRRLTSAWYGRGASFKRRAIELAVERVS